jgi:hypothetical protein
MFSTCTGGSLYTQSRATHFVIFAVHCIIFAMRFLTLAIYYTGVKHQTRAIVNTHTHDLSPPLHESVSICSTMGADGCDAHASVSGMIYVNC